MSPSPSPVSGWSARLERGFLVALVLATGLVAAHSPIILGGADAWYGMVDHWRQALPNYFVLDSAIDAGEVPLWNPLTFCGTPIAAHPAWHPFYPPNLLRSLLVDDPTPLRTHTSMALLVAVHVGLAAIGAYLLARDHGLSVPAALIAALGFVLGAAFTHRVCANHFMRALPWVPFVLLAARRVIFVRPLAGKIRAAIVGGLFAGLLVLGGPPQIVYYTAVLGIVYCALLFATHARLTGPRRVGNPVACIGALAVMGLLAALVGAVILLPASEFASFSPRGAESEVALGAGRLKIGFGEAMRLLTVFPGDIDPAVIMESLRLPRFAGLGVLILGVASLLHRDWRQVVPIAGVFLLFLDVSLGSPVSGALFTEILSPYQAGNPDRAAVMVAPMLGLLAGFGADAVTSAGRVHRGTLRRIVAFAIGAAFFLVGLVGMRGGTALLANPAVVVGPILVLVVVAFGARVGRAAVWLPLLVVFVVGELVAWNIPYVTTLADERGFKEPIGHMRKIFAKNQYKGLAQRPEMWSDNRRGVSEPPNQSMLRLAPAMNGYDPLYIDAVREVICGPGRENRYFRSVSADEVTARSGAGFLFLKRSFWLARRYVDGPLPPKGRSFPPTTTVFLPDPPEGLPVPRVDLEDVSRSCASEDTNVRVIASAALVSMGRERTDRGELYEVRTDLKRRHSVLTFDYSASDECEIETVLRESIDGPKSLGKTHYVVPGHGTLEVPLPDWKSVYAGILVRTPKAAKLGEVSIVEDRADEDRLIRVTERKFNSVSLEVGELAEDRILFFADAAYPGWEATIDGERVPIHLANDAFKAIHVPPGRHDVQFSFRPSRVRTGLIVSLLAVLASAVSLFFLWRTGTRHRRPTNVLPVKNDEAPPGPLRNTALEGLIYELNELLEPAQRSLVELGRDTRFPPVLVLGVPRSGTTLVLQWLAASGEFAYPTNLLARFSSTPAIGARIQLMLTDPRFAMGDELGELATRPDFSSELGKTSGVLSPNEFMFFWRRFLATHELRRLSDAEVAATKDAELRAELAALEAVFERPLAMKGLMLQFNLEVFARMLEKAFFLYVERDPVHNAQSLVAAREKYHGTREEWWSVKPEEYEELRRLDPLRQVAGQVHYTNAAIRAGLDRVPEERWLHVRYEDFCADPGATWRRLREKLAALGLELPDYSGAERFESTNRDRLLPEDVEALRRALDEVRSRDN